MENVGLVEGSFGTPGWRKEPSGIIIQWGYGLPSAGRSTIVFPIPFPTRVFNVTFGYRESSYPTYAQSIVIDDPTLTVNGFVCRCMNASTPVTNSASAFFWRAEGR